MSAASVGLDAWDPTTAQNLTFRAGSSTKTVTVRWATSYGSAHAPSDYAAASGKVTFSPGQTEKTVAVQVKGDNLHEPDETMNVTLSKPTNSRIGTAVGIGTIRTDE